MATLVKEIMNRELLAVHPRDSAEEVLFRLLAFKVSGAPVVGEDGGLLGVVSWRDVAGVEGAVEEFMSAPAVTISLDEPLESAALLLAQSGQHRVIVVDQAIPVGVVSTLDVIRGLLGLPSPHPSTFPHFDPELGLRFSDDQVLSPGRVGQVPEVEGLLVLVHGGKARAEQVVWVEACSNLRVHLLDVLENKHTRIPRLSGELERGELRFRFAEAPDVTRRMKALRTVLFRARDARREALGHPPQGVPDATI